MKAILDVPVSAEQGEQALGSGERRGQTGETVDEFVGGLAVAGNAAFELKDLGDIGPTVGQIVGQFGTGAQGPNLQTSMTLIDGGGAVLLEPSRARLGEEQGNVVAQGGLVGFSEQEIIAALSAELARPGLVGMQRIGTHDHTAQVAVGDDRTGGALFSAFAGQSLVHWGAIGDVVEPHEVVGVASQEGVQ